MNAKTLSYHEYRFSPEIISQRSGPLPQKRPSRTAMSALTAELEGHATGR